MSSSSQEITFVFRFNSLRAKSSVDKIASVLTRYHLASEKFLFEDQSVTLKALAGSLEQAARDTFTIEGETLGFSQARVANFDLDFLEIRLKSPDISPDVWAAEFVGNDTFVMGWVTDAEYEFWQNAESVQQYEAAGKAFQHLAMKSNGLPPPLQKTIIDTSNNPGRRVLQSGYIEAVGAIMWLAPNFWKWTGADETAVETASWLKVSRPIPNVVRIQAADTCFVSDRGRDRDLQERLRALLYPSTVNRRPTGS